MTIRHTQAAPKGRITEDLKPHNLLRPGPAQKGCDHDRRALSSARPRCVAPREIHSQLVFVKMWARLMEALSDASIMLLRKLALHKKGKPVRF